jgi:hypothetical protein
MLDLSLTLTHSYSRPALSMFTQVAARAVRRSIAPKIIRSCSTN